MAGFFNIQIFTEVFMKVCPNCNRPFRGNKVEVVTPQGTKKCLLHRSCGTLIEDVKESKEV